MSEFLCSMIELHNYICVNYYANVYCNYFTLTVNCCCFQTEVINVDGTKVKLQVNTYTYFLSKLLIALLVEWQAMNYMQQYGEGFVRYIAVVIRNRLTGDHTV